MSKEYSATHYQLNKETYIARNRRRREAATIYVNEFKKDKPCLDCGKVYPNCVMEFDHKFDKLFDIARAASTGYSLETIQKEIDKCELVCANCHRIRTHAGLVFNSLAYVASTH